MLSVPPNSPPALLLLTLVPLGLSLLLKERLNSLRLLLCLVTLLGKPLPLPISFVLRFPLDSGCRYTGSSCSGLYATCTGTITGERC